MHPSCVGHMRDFHSGIEDELRQEQAASLKRSAKKLQAALAELAECPDGHAREALLEAAAERAWYFVILREQMGLTHTNPALDFYKVPGEVRVRMGAKKR